MGRCSVYIQKRTIYIAVVLCTEYGVPIARPFTKITITDDFKIGQAIISAFNIPQREISQPQSGSEWKKIEKELYQFLEVKNWSELIKMFGYIDIECVGSKIKMYTYKLGKEGGYEPDGGCVTCSNKDPWEIGRAVLKAFKIELDE